MVPQNTRPYTVLQWRYAQNPLLLLIRLTDDFYIHPICRMLCRSGFTAPEGRDKGIFYDQAT